MAAIGLGTAGDPRPRVVFIHGDVAAAARAWRKQRPLAADWLMVTPDRPGFGGTVPVANRVDFDAEATSLAPLLEPSAHLVGHSYGAVVALVIATRHPRRVRSLTLLEPPAYGLARGEPVVEAQVEALDALFREGPREPEAFLRAFGELIGERVSPVSPLPPEIEHGARLLMGERGPWEAVPDLGILHEHAVPVLVVSGGHNAAMEFVCDRIAERAGAQRLVLEGAGHNIPRVGRRLNEALGAFLRHVEDVSSRA